MQRFLNPEMLARVDALEKIATEVGISLAELALAWVLREPNVAKRVSGSEQAGTD